MPPAVSVREAADVPRAEFPPKVSRDRLRTSRRYPATDSRGPESKVKPLDESILNSGQPLSTVQFYTQSGVDEDILARFRDGAGLSERLKIPMDRLRT